MLTEGRNQSSMGFGSGSGFRDVGRTERRVSGVEHGIISAVTSAISITTGKQLMRACQGLSRLPHIGCRCDGLAHRATPSHWIVRSRAELQRVVLGKW